VKEGTTTVTYIYRHVPQITESVTETTTEGNVNVKYVDTEGKEIKDLYKLVENGLVSTTKTTTTTVDGVPSSKEETVASGLTYDATTQKPTSITSNGKVYELVQVKDGDVEKGLVKKGTTTITYIYRHVPQVTTDVQTSTATGSVTVHYVDTEGNEIQGAVDLVTDGVVSTTTTTTTTTDGVASVTEDTVASGLSYDATTQKPTSITSNGKVYELVQVKDGDVEKGLVKKGTTTITYIYKVAPNTTETISTKVFGTVKTRYVDADTGEEIVSGSTIVDNGIVANKVTTIVRDAAGNVVSETTDIVPTRLTYDTTADKTAKNAEIALKRVRASEYILGTGDFEYYKERYFIISYTDDGDTITIVQESGDSTQTTVYVKDQHTVTYSLDRVDKEENGTVEEGTKTITYYYRRPALNFELTAVPKSLESSTVATLARDY
ncbi:MucBP domain-containing protein, partial [Streptococcus suis]